MTKIWLAPGWEPRFVVTNYFKNTIQPKCMVVTEMFTALQKASNSFFIHLVPCQARACKSPKIWPEFEPITV